MRLHIFSDLHLEFGDFEPAKVDADVIVLAGDVHMGVKGLKWILRHWPTTPVIYVVGNHEFYREKLPALTKRLRRLCNRTNIHLLENESAEIGGVRFLGCTLWTDFKVLGDAELARAVADKDMTDYFEILFGIGERCLQARDTELLHLESRAWLERQLSTGIPERTVVVTHHAPSALSIPPYHAGSILNAAFVSNLDQLVGASGIPLWIHGHTHHCVDYRIGSTRVLANQRGYPDRPAAGFDPGLVVEA